MKVLHVVHSLNPGGMENGIVNLACALEPRGIKMHVACLDRRGTFADRLPGASRVFALRKGPGFSPVAVWNLSEFLERVQPDVVHSHNLAGLVYGGLATLGGWRWNLIHGEHSQLTEAERHPKRLRLRQWLYRGCRAIHTVADAMRNELVACGFPAEKITAIANGVDTVHFAPGDRAAARAALGLPADAVCIGIVGRFGPFKRHLELIDAFEIFGTTFPSAHLLVAGSGGSEETAVQARVEGSPMRDRIHLLGFQDDPRRCYHALDLLAVPSANEGLSNAVLEAMACGVPALGRAGCGHEQVIESGVDGWITPLDSPVTFAARLGEILMNPANVVASGLKAREKVREHFSLASMINAYESFYRACAPAPR